jgi:hypothetical protein
MIESYTPQQAALIAKTYRDVHSVESRVQSSL